MLDKLIFESNSENETFEIAKTLGENAKPQDVFCLVGDLGVGKTIFTKGFAIGMGIEEAITSPTFTIINVHEVGRLPLYHFDVYRIGDIEEMDELGYEDYFFGQGVTFVEWANLIEELIPKEATWIYMRKDLEKGLDYRLIEIR